MRKLFLRPASNSRASLLLGIRQKFAKSGFGLSGPSARQQNFYADNLRYRRSDGGPYMATIGKSVDSIIYGTDSFFQLCPAAGPGGKKKSSSRWHLSIIKVPIVTKNFDFEAIYPGTFCEPGDFQFVHPNGYLTITNLTGATGIVEDTEDGGGYDIPTTQIVPGNQVVTSIIARPTPID